MMSADHHIVIVVPKACACALCSMWRITCLGFFGVFAWGMTWDLYGTQILAHYYRIIDAAQVVSEPLIV